MSQNYVSPTTQPTSSPSADEPNIRQNDDALLTNFSGATPPTLTVAGMHWFDTTNKILYIRNADNNDWVMVTNTLQGIGNDVSGSTTIALADNGKVVLANSPLAPETLFLPDFNQVSPDFRVYIFIYENGQPLTIQAQSGQSFLRDGTLKSSISIQNNENTLLQLSVYSNQNFMLSGNLKGVDSDLSTLTNAGKKAILDLIHPIGSIYTTFTNTTPPLNGVLGVSWGALAEGYAVMTGNTSNTGSAGGGNRLDTGATTGHSLSQAELPSYFLSGGSLSVNGNVGLKTPNLRPIGSSTLVFSQQFNDIVTGITDVAFSGTGSVSSLSSGGSNVAHTHPLNALNYKLLMYRRIS